MVIYSTQAERTTSALISRFRLTEIGRYLQPSRPALGHRRIFGASRAHKEDKKKVNLYSYLQCPTCISKALR